MTKLMLLVILTLCFSIVYPQNDFFVFKKKNKTIANYYKGSYIAFQLNRWEWQTGYITRVKNDSFWIKPMVVYYSMMGTDTVHFNVLSFTLSDVYAMPKKGILVSYIKGRFQISRSGGHVHWYWVKSGWVFRVGATGYATLNIMNGVIQNNFSISNSKNKLGIAASVFLFGTLLKLKYKPTLRIGKKYHLESIKLSK